MMTTSENQRIEPVDIYRLRPRRGVLRELVTVDLSRKPAPPATAFPVRRAESPGTFSSGRGADLAIDFGTSAIAAALVGGNYAVEELRLGDEKILPSPFGRHRWLDRSRLVDNYDLSYGDLAGGRAAPGRAAPGGVDEEYYPCLKRRIEWLARSRTDREWEREAVLDVAAVCQLALEQARDRHRRTLAQCLEGDFRTYITVPNAFPVAAIEVLRRGVGYGVAAALRRRKRPAVRALLEAEAVAYGAIAGPSLGVERGRRTLLVVDAGAGTTDATILRLEDGDLRVLAHVGLPVGGMDLDVFLASLRGPFRGAPVSQWLGTAREAKQRHLREGAGEPAELFARLGGALVRHYGWPAERRGRPLGEAIAGVWERYMALAVKSLVRALPEDAVTAVDEVVLSGRGSLLAGFREAVRRTLAERGPGLEPQCAEDPEDRKLAVVRGVGAYVASTFASRDRRPTRSSFEIFLRHGSGRELTLLPAGHPLVRGWGVAAWYQPRPEIGLGPARPRVEMRLVPREVLKNLAAEGSFGDRDLEELLRWSVLPVLQIEDKPPPYSARLAFDFLSLAARLEVDGRPIPRLGRSQQSFGRRHPVHQLDDNWFELSP